METTSTASTRLQGPVRERLLSHLRELGLTGYAAKAYVSLLLEPRISAGRICKATGIPDSKIYYALEELARHHLVVVQQGNPSLYRPADAKQAAENLKHEVEEDFHRRIGSVEDLEREIEPFLASHEDEEGIELAYIVKANRNILTHMIRTIENAEVEILLMISDWALLNGLLPALEEAQKRRVKVKVAIYGNQSELKSLRFTELKLSNCDCNLLMVDSKRLVTVSRPGEESTYAIITGDPNMISLSRSFYDNPSCCSLLRISSTSRSKA